MCDIKIKRFILLFLSAYSLPVLAVNAVSQRIQELLTEMVSYHSNFSQTLYNEKGDTLQQAKGTFALKKPNQFRWETFSPFKQILLSDGKTFWNYEVELEQAVTEPADRILKETPIAVLSYGKNIGDAFDIKSIKQDPSPSHTEWFQLLPKHKESKELFSNIDLQFIGNVLREMKIIDKLGQISHIIFHDPRINFQIEETIFKIEIPKGVDVIVNTHEEN